MEKKEIVKAAVENAETVIVTAREIYFFGAGLVTGVLAKLGFDKASKAIKEKRQLKEDQALDEDDE